MKFAPAPLFTERQIRRRVEEMAAEIARSVHRPDLAAPVLVGAFVFAADLLRALSRLDVPLRVEPLWLRGHGNAREGATDVVVIVPPNATVRGRSVLLIDGVLDRGSTLAKARDLLLAFGAVRIVTAVAIDKRLPGAAVQADFAAFTHVDCFVVGYGMDDAGRGRTLPYIAAAD